MRKSFILSGLIFSLTVSIYAQQEWEPTFEDTLEVYNDLFYINEPLHLTLTFDVKDFQRTRKDEKYKKAKMTCVVSDSFQVTHEVRVKARGIYRRDNCQMPPFWLNIRYAGIETEQLANVVKMKVVTRCKSSSVYDEYVLREFLTYKIYNLLSPYSFNTRLVRLTFVDTGRKGKVSENWGFICEPEEMMAERNNAMPIRSDRLSVRTVNQEIMDHVAFFCYMIGQGDYSVTGRHNLKVLTLKDYGPTGFIPVPYDFDYSGLVNTSYAIPDYDLGIDNVRDRYYLGACRSEEEYEKTIQWLASFHDEINELILSFKYLDEDEKVDMVEYIDSYYRETEQKNFIRRRILSTCR
jgi:hypothetical protein